MYETKKKSTKILKKYMIKKIKEEPKIPEPTSHNKFDTDDCLE